MYPNTHSYKVPILVNTVRRNIIIPGETVIQMFITLIVNTQTDFLIFVIAST